MGFSEWWWWPNPFGLANETTILWTFIGLGIIVILPVVAFVYLASRIIFKNMHIDRRLKKSKYAEKHKREYFRIDQKSGVVVLRSGIHPGANEEWVLVGDVITMKPGVSDKQEVTVSFSQIAKLEIQSTQSSWKFGAFSRFRIWRNDGIPSLELHEDELPDYSLAFKPIAMEAVFEIERRFNEYAATQKSK